MKPNNQTLEEVSLNENLTYDKLVSLCGGGVSRTYRIIPNKPTAIIFHTSKNGQKYKKGTLIARYEYNNGKLFIERDFTEKFLRILENYKKRQLKLDEDQKDLLYFTYLCTFDKRYIPYMQLIVRGGM